MRLYSLLNWSIAIIIISLMMVVSIVSVSAATITSANDIPESLAVSTNSNHTVSFTTPSGASEGETIVLTFGSAFTTTSLTEDDVDISDDSVDLTTAADCTGSEEASVAVSSNSVTITICSGDGGAIVAASAVVIEVGDNATASGTGSNKATNPSVSGTHYLSIGGTFSDSGSMALPILTSGSDVSVTATITAGADPVDGDDGVDTTAPSISSVIASSITATSATITWTTNETANSYVDYSTDDSFDTTESSAYVYVTSHSMDLSDLEEGTVYNFQVRSTDANGNTATSSAYTFTTLDVTAPTISDISVTDISYNSATIIWTTDEAATSQIDYGLDATYGSTESDSDYVLSHSITVTGLDDLTSYHFAVTSEDASFNIAISSDDTFTTLEDLPPDNVSNFSVAENDGQLDLSWNNPTDEDFVGVYAVYCLDDYPSAIDDEDCEVLFDDVDAGTAYSHTELTNDIPYYYGLFSYDEAGQFASGALGVGTPSEPEEEVPSDDAPVDDSGDDDTGGGEVPTEDDTSDTTDSDTGSGSGSDVAVCGDGYCSEGETYALCPQDCEQGESGSTDLGTPFEEGDAQFLVADDSLSLLVTSSGVVRVMAGTSVHFSLLTASLIPDADYLMVDVDNEMYLLALTEEDLRYEATFVAPEQEGEYDLSLGFVATDGSKEFRSFTMIVEGVGYAYELIDENEVVVEGVVFTLFYATGSMGMWDASPYMQTNPYSSTEGTYGWYVPVSTYYVRAEKDGYEIAQTGAFRSGDSIINKGVEMIQITSEGSGAITSDEETVVVEVVEIGMLEVIGLDQEVVDEIAVSILEFRDSETVQEVAEISVPALAVTAGVSLIIMGIAFDFLPFLQYLFTAPLLFLWRRKRKSFGVVYNSLRKTPIDLATVRLYRFKNEEDAKDHSLRGKLVKSRVTDKLGRYFFLAPKGHYRLTVTKSGFSFPTSHLQNEKEDGEYLDVYHAEVISVTEKDATIGVNIPLDPVEQTEMQASKKAGAHANMRKLQTALSLTGVFASIIFAVIRPHMSAYIMIAVQLIVYLFARRLARPRKPTSWGIVYDKYTGRPLTNVVARIFEPKFNRLIETQVTDGKGRYSFLLGPNQYFARFERPGFTPLEVRPIDLMQTEGANDFAINIGLDPDMSQQAPPLQPPQQPIQT